MIDVKELRVGAHVCFNAKRVKILGIDVANDKDVPIIINTSAASVEPAEVNPIPLTIELLQEIGFHPYPELARKSYDYYAKELDGFRIIVATGYTTYDNREWTAFVENWDYDAIAWDDVDYLHNLENLVYNCIKKEVIDKE